MKTARPLPKFHGKKKMLTYITIARMQTTWGMGITGEYPNMRHDEP